MGNVGLALGPWIFGGDFFAGLRNISEKISESPLSWVSHLPRVQHLRATSLLMRVAPAEKLLSQLMPQSFSPFSVFAATMVAPSPAHGDRHDLPATLRLAAELGPGVHQLAALLEQIAAPVCSLDRVRDRVR